MTSIRFIILHFKDFYRDRETKARAAARGIYSFYIFLKQKKIFFNFRDCTWPSFVSVRNVVIYVASFNINEIYRILIRNKAKCFWV